MDYDMTELEKTGAEYEDLQAKMKAVRAHLRELVLAANAAGVRQVEIVKASRYTRDAVRVIVRDAVLDKAGEAPDHPDAFTEREQPKR